MTYLSLWNENQNPWRKLFERAFSESEQGDAFFSPTSEVEETESHFVMSVDLPGVSKKDITIEVRDNFLEISGERKSEKKEKNLSERAYGKFYRTLRLPTAVDAEKIEAHFENGVLTVALPKAETAKPRQIKIAEGKGNFFEKLIGKEEKAA